MLVEQLKFDKSLWDDLGQELGSYVLHFEDSWLFKHLVKLIYPLLLDWEECEALKAFLQLLERIVDKSWVDQIEFVTLHFDVKLTFYFT